MCRREGGIWTRVNDQSKTNGWSLHMNAHSTLRMIMSILSGCELAALVGEFSLECSTRVRFWISFIDLYPRREYR